MPFLSIIGENYLPTSIKTVAVEKGKMILNKYVFIVFGCKYMLSFSNNNTIAKFVPIFCPTWGFFPDKLLSV